jgi:protein TonB
LLAVIPAAGVALAVFAKPASEADKSVDICLAPVETVDIPLQPDASRAVNLYVEKDGDVYCSVGGNAFFKHEKQQIDIELDDVVSQGVMDAYENGKPTTVHITCEEGTDVEKYKSVHSQARTALTLAKSKVDNPEKIDERIAVHNNEYRALLGSSAVADNDTIYKVVENLPEFPGGTGELMTYLMKNLVYPQECNAVPGFGMRVIVRVVVEKDGSLSGITVLNDKDNNKETAENKMAREAARNEAVRVVKSMPKWTPAKHKGKTVRCYFTMPVTFRTN